MAFPSQPSDRSGSTFCLILNHPAPAFAHAMPGFFNLFCYRISTRRELSRPRTLLYKEQLVPDNTEETP
jgi:hypothetical protein